MTPGVPTEVPATDAEAVARIARAVEGRTGIRVQGAQRARFRRAILGRMDELGQASIAAYVDRVEAEPAEWRRLIPAIAVGETLFFRDRARWASIRDHVLPGLVRAAGNGPVRLWSAGCATGQEAYGLAMVWAGPAAGGPAAEVVGSDLNPEALEVARRAEYTRRAMRGLGPEEVAVFFEPCAGGHRVRPEVCARVRFEELNLAEWAATGPWPARFDLILCQHVLIYFSPAVTERVLTALARSLRPGGMLMVGHTETMTPPEGCVLEWVGGSSGFRKPRLGPEAWVDRGPVAPPAGPDPARVIERAWDDVVGERYAAARDRLEALPLTGEALRLAAWIAVCRREWDLARDLAERSVSAEVAHPDGHFVAAMAALGAGRTEDAVRLLKRAVYLDPHFSVAHFHLAELEARRGHGPHARRAWRNAARASGGDGQRIRRYLGGFDAAALAQACEGRYAAGGSP